MKSRWTGWRRLLGLSRRRTIVRCRPRTRPYLERLENRITPSFMFVTGDTDGTLYAVDTSGSLHWYKDTSRDGSGFSFNAPNEGAVIGTGWNQFTHVICGGNGELYAIEPNGDLLWYKDTARNGTWGWDPNSGSVIGTGWNVFSQVFSGGNGMLYAIEPNGDLLWYQDLAQNGTADWAVNSGNMIGTGWNNFIDVISNGNGIIYGRGYNREVRWYQDLAQNGTADWAANSGNVVATNWSSHDISHIVAGGEYNGGGIIYGIDDYWSVSSDPPPTGVRSSNLEFFKDDAQDGTSLLAYEGGDQVDWSSSHGWDSNSSNVVGVGWVYPTVEGYASAQSVAAGDPLSFYISTGGTTLTVTYLRLHEDLSSGNTDEASIGPFGIPVSTSFQVPGQERLVTTSQPWAGAGWDQDPNHPADFSLTVPSSWQSGLYAAQVVDDRGYVLYIPFVVKPTATGHHNSIAVLVNTNTWNSYNDWGGVSRYVGLDPYDYPITLSFLRPDPQATPIYSDIVNGHLTPGEVWMLSWLDNAGYSYDVYTDSDFDSGIPGLNQYQTLIVDTHPEYWTVNEYQNLQGYLNQGGDLLYLGGNGIFDSVQETSDGTGMIVPDSPTYRADAPGSDPWPCGSLFQLNGMDEGALLGVDYYWANDGQSGAPYQVSTAGASNFFFQGTGLQAGALIGQIGLYAPASGWETDQTWQGGNIPGLQVLATGTNTDTSGADMTYYTTPADGFVFSAGSITFTNSLVIDPELQAIVENALNGVLTYQMPAGTSENVTLQRNGELVELVDDQTGVVVASGPVGAVRSVQVIGADGENEGLTLDYSAGGYFPLENGLTFEGASSNILSVVGAGDIANADYQPDPATSGSGVLTLDSTVVTFADVGSLSISGAGGFVFDDYTDPTSVTYTLTASSVLVSNGQPAVTFTNVGDLTVYGGSGDDTFNVENTYDFGSNPTYLATGAGNNQVYIYATQGNLQDDNNGGSNFTDIGVGSLAGINGWVHVYGSNPISLLVDDSSDTTSRTATLTNNQLTGLGNAGTIYYGSVPTNAVTSLTVDGGSGDNTYYVDSTGYGITTTLNSGPGSDTVLVYATGGALNINNAGTAGVNVGVGDMSTIKGAVDVYGAGATDLTLDDSSDTASHTVAMNDGLVTGLAPAAIYWTPSSSSSGGVVYLGVVGSSVGSTYNVNNTSSFYYWTSLQVGAGNDTVNVYAVQGDTQGNVYDLYVEIDGFSDSTDIGVGTLAYINGGVAVEGGGTTALLLDDHLDATVRTATLTSTQLTGLGNAGTISYDSSVTSLTLDGSSKGSTYNIQGTPSGAAVTVNGQAGSDTFNVGDTSNTLNGIQGVLTINGGTGSNTLNVYDQGSSSGQNYTLSSTVLARIGATITYASLAHLNVYASNGGNDLLTLLNPAPTVATNFSGGTGANTMQGANATNTWTIGKANGGTVGKVTFSNFQNLIGGTGNDTFKFSGSGSIDGAIDGGGGSANKLDYSALGSSFLTNVTLASNTAGSAPRIGGGFSNIASLAGSTDTSNTLTGPNLVNLWTITGNKAGKLNTFAFTNMPNLVGGTNIDTFKFSGTSSKEASIDGGGASNNQGDWLDFSSIPSSGTVTVNLANGTAQINTNPVIATAGIQNVIGSASGTNNLTGDAQGNILVGGSGANTLTGGDGNSLLIGGSGHGTITGGTGEDIEVAGTTTYSATTTAGRNALMAILAELQSNDTFAQKVYDLIHGTDSGDPNGAGSDLNGKNKLTWGVTGATVKASTGAFTLTGDSTTESIADWFFSNASSTVSDFDTGVDEHNNNALGVY